MSNCRVCGYEKLFQIYHLGNIPPINAFLSKEEKTSEVGYPLELMWCERCTLVQLNEVVSPEKLFTSYRFMTSASSVSVKHMNDLASTLHDRFDIRDDTKILEIGSNDGTLLQALKRYTPNVLGVDPAANLVPVCASKGVESIPSFFSNDFAKNLQRGRFDLILALNVVAHTPEVVDLLRGVKSVLSPNGTFVMEFPYVCDTVLRGEFDTVYHEHVYQFSLNSISYALAEAGLRAYDVEKVNAQGGSVRVYVGHSELERPHSQNFKNLMLLEHFQENVKELETYKELKEKFLQTRDSIISTLLSAKERYGKIIALGAPARGVVIVNACQVDDCLSVAVDDTTLKQGRMLPGTNIPVVSWNDFDKDAKCFFMLSWNYTDAMLAKLKMYVKDATVIIPFPELKVVKL